jgi:predicted Zn finger-like uncharacterized protein
MEIICENCKARLNIPDEKIPQDQDVAISCPKCKNRLTVRARGPANENSTAVVDEKASAEIGSPDTEDTAGDVDDILEFYQEGLKLALVLGNETHETEALRRAVEDLGYRYLLGQNSRDAMGKMRLHKFDLVILSDQFDGIELEQSPVLLYMNNLPMSIRRRIFFTLVGDTFKTMDPMAAFGMSANLVINRGDFSKLKAVLSGAISDNEKFYKVFTDTLEEVGRS